MLKELPLLSVPRAKRIWEVSKVNVGTGSPCLTLPQTFCFKFDRFLGLKFQ
jgi:hypothetical protein